MFTMNGKCHCGEVLTTGHICNMPPITQPEHTLTKEQEERFNQNEDLGAIFYGIKNSRDIVKQHLADEIARERERCIQILSLTEMGEKQARYLLTPDKE